MFMLTPRRRRQRDADTRRCREDTGGTVGRAEPRPPTGSDDECQASRRGGHSSDVPAAEGSATPHYHRVPAASGAQADMEDHCRCSQESSGLSDSSSQESGSSSFL